MLNLRQMEVFHAIMRTGSVTGAARLLNVTQPAVSATLKHTESHLRMKLFLRAGGRLQPPPEAEAIFPDVAEIFGRINAVGRFAQDLSCGRLGTLTVAGSFPLANGVLARAVADFIKDRPEASVSLLSLTSPQVLERVVSREVELGIAYEPVVSPAVETKVLMDANVACVLRSDHPLARHEEIDLRWLNDYPVITYLPQNLFRAYVDRAMDQAGVVPRISVLVGLSLTGIMLARSGAGIALVEPFLVSQMGVPDLAVRPLRPRIQMKTLIIQSKSAPQSNIAREFIAVLRDLVSSSSGSYASL